HSYKHIPIPIRLSSTQNTTKRFKPLRAVAKLIERKSASSLVQGARAPSARTPSTMDSSTKEAICLNSGCVELSIAIVIAPVVEVELSSPTKLVRYSCN